MSQKRSFTDDDFIRAVEGSKSWAAVLRYLHLAPAGGNYANLKALAARLHLNLSHMTGQGWRVGVKTPIQHVRSLKDILKVNSPFNTSHLRERLLKEKIFERKCYGCDNVDWLGRPISLELEHKNGIRSDNRLENLTLLCPNCHAQTETYRGRNMGRTKDFA